MSSIQDGYLVPLAALLTLVAGCNPAPGTTDASLDARFDARDVAPDEIAPDAGPPTLVARFAPPSTGRPALFSIPFPSDIYLDATGAVVADLTDFSALGIRRNGPVLGSSYAGLDGFGRNAGAIFVVDASVSPSGMPLASVDPASLPTTGADSLAPDAGAFIVDLDPSLSPSAARIPTVAGWHEEFHAITVQAENAVLASGHRYAFVITTHVHGTDASVLLAASPPFALLRDLSATARSTPLEVLYGNALDRVAAVLGPGFDRSTIADMAVFTTQTRARQLQIAAGAIRAGMAGPPPTLNTDATVAMPLTVARFGSSAHAGWTATLDAWLGPPRTGTSGQELPGFPDPDVEGPGVGMAHDAIGAIFTGTFVAPDYRGSDGAITFDASGVPVATHPQQQISVTFALPHGPIPARGFPVMIWGHGLGNHRRHMLAIANEMARRGIATVAIDTVTFGQRSDPTDVTTLEAGSYHGPDGFGDHASYAPDAFFGNLQSIVAFRDNLRQAVLDLVQLRRLVGNPSLDLSFARDEYGGVAPTLDAGHVAYAGDSLGGLLGTVFAAVERDVNPFVLNVPGGAIFTALATDAPIIGSLLGTVPTLLFGAPSPSAADRFNPVFNLLQIAIDSADPASFASEVTSPSDGSASHDVWMVESLWDEIISNRSTALLARTMQLPQITPLAIAIDGFATVPAPLSGNLRGGATGGLFQMVPSTHGANIANRYGVRTYVPPFPQPGSTRFPLLAQTYRVRQPIVGYQAQIGAFLTSAFTGHATIAVVGIEPLLDMDDDGWTDDEERSAGTSPYDPTSHPTGAPPHVRDVGF